ncbi:hypothetical protein ACIQCR_19470 [Streptomyces sp. NPDC093249]
MKGDGLFPVAPAGCGPLPPLRLAGSVGTGSPPRPATHGSRQRSLIRPGY